MQTSDGKRDGEPMNAYEYAVDELEAAEEPMSPAKLADGYGCSGGHMRSVLCDLVRDREAERIAHGRYIEGPGPQSKEPEIWSSKAAQGAANTADLDDIPADAFGSVSPGLALVVATALVAAAMVVSTSPPGSEPEESDGATGWE
jgi:hypothetical protein